MSSNAQFTHAHMTRFDWPMPAAPDVVWGLLTDTGCLPGWYGDGVIEGRVGGKVELLGGHIKGVVTQWMPRRKLAYTWNVFMLG